MNLLHTIRNYYFYCGIEKDEYNALKKDAYISNFKVWRILHILMAAVFGALFISTLFNDLTRINRWFYLAILIYSLVAIWLFFILEKDAITAQFMIYLSISVLFLFGAFITQNKPEMTATTFIVMLLITPMFMIDKPVFMTIELCAASTVFLIWMHGVKPYEVWQYDVINVATYTLVGIFLNIIANSIRIKEFVLTRKINIQKDTDAMTGIHNKGALTREINEYLADDGTDKGIMLLLDVDRFKAINDTWGHDVGDRVIIQMGDFLNRRFTGSEIAGRFGGDEFIVFLKDTDDPDVARRTAEDVITGMAQQVTIPGSEQKISISIGIAIREGGEKNYSEIFKKADTALYRAKADREKRYYFYE